MVAHPLWRPYDSSANAHRQYRRVAHRQIEPGPLQKDHWRWAELYGVVQRLVDDTIEDQVLDICHVGSTAVPLLVAKPVLDIDLIVPAVEDERAYLPQLQAAGFRLIFRDDISGDAHRQLTLGAPNTNLHVWSPDAVEPQRHQLFNRWLRSHAVDRDRYTRAKLSAGGREDATRYNDGKSAVIYDIYERIFLADQNHLHDPQPRA